MNDSLLGEEQPMKRLTAPWTTALATTALLALPAAGGAQTPQTPPEPQPEQSTTLSTPSAQDQKQTQADSPAEHLRQAKAALASVDANNVPARAKSQLATIQRHINSLERSVAAKDSASATGTEQRNSKATAGAGGKAGWANDVAAIDRIISELAGSSAAPMSGTGDPGTAGTSGERPATKSGKSSTAVTLDETSRNQLLEVRSHITAFAAAMSGTSSPMSGSSSPSSPSSPAPHSTSAHGSAATGHAGAATTGQTGSATGETAQAGQAGSSPAQSGSTGTTGTTGQAGSTTGTSGQTTPPATGEPGQAGQPAEPGQPDQTAQAQDNVDPDAAKQHLTAARDSLTQLTQLPAAAQLQGEARTQVSQLIQNFNELITTKEDWRTTYEKLEANLTALIGPPQDADAAMPSATPSATPQASTPQASTPANPTGDPQAQGTQSTQGTPGAVGTSGTATTTATLDPGIRQKLVEFRNHLKAFHAAAGGDANDGK
jgi:pilus assembly protein FimV